MGAFTAFERFAAGKISAEGCLRRHERYNPNGRGTPPAAETQNEKQLRKQLLFILEQVKGIEPSCSAWEADILPLNYTCTSIAYLI